MKLNKFFNINLSYFNLLLYFSWIINISFIFICFRSNWSIYIRSSSAIFLDTKFMIICHKICHRSRSTNIELIIILYKFYRSKFHGYHFWIWQHLILYRKIFIFNWILNVIWDYGLSDSKYKQDIIQII